MFSTRALVASAAAVLITGAVALAAGGDARSLGAGLAAGAAVAVAAAWVVARAERRERARRAEAELRVHRAARELAESRARLDLAIQGAGMATWEADLETGLIDWSESHFRIFGYPPAQDGKATIEMWRSRIHPDDRVRVAEAVWQAFRTRAPSEIAYRIVRADTGEVRWVSTFGQFLAEQAGGAHRFTGVMFDTTDRERAQEEVRLQAEAERQARAEAQAASRAKDEFLAMLGHELRNPLAAITSAVGVLDVMGADERTAPARGVLRRQAGLLARLVDDLLDVGRVVGGKVRLERVPLDLAELASRHVATLRASGHLEQHRVTFRADSVWVYGDEGRLEQVLANLLTNAVRYTGPGGTIEVEVRREGAEAVLTVRDTGIGIPPDLLPRVFDLFAQGERETERARGGLGVGLTLVQHLVKLHGGTASAASEGTGRGTTLTVRLPAISAPSSPAAATASALSDVPARQVLVVEDNDDAREMLTTMLELGGHRVRAAADGARGVELGLEGDCEVVLVDIGLPVLDGYEVARRLRAARGRDLTLVALTGYGQPEDRARALAAGFDAHVVKPVDPLTLARVLAGAAPRGAEGA